jgi:hypothetical protein
MKGRVVVVLGIACALGAGVAYQRWALVGLEAREPGAVAPPQPVAPPALPVPCLAPDERLLQAVGDVHRMLTGTPHQAATARFEGGEWHVDHRGVAVGTVPEYPDFADMTGLLAAWARRLGVRSVFPAQPGVEATDVAEGRLGRMHAILAAAECDRLAGGGARSAGLLALGARALVMLELQTTDGVGIADRVAARALALVSACRAEDSTAVAREACLLAHRMGYGAWAWAAAGGLAEDDPIRLFVRQEDARLAAVAARRGASAEARFLRLRRIADQRDPARWSAWLRSAFDADDAISLPAIGTGLELRAFETRVPTAYLVFLTVAGELRLLEAASGPAFTSREVPPVAAFVSEFEGMLGRMSSGADGLFLDRDVLGAYYRASFYTALWAVGEHYRQALSSLPAAQEFADALTGLPAGPATEFAGWYAHLVQAKGGRADLADLRQDLERTRSFGAPLLLRTVNEMRDRAGYASTAPRVAAVALARRLDTRPTHRSLFGTIAGLDLLMLPLAEDLLASAAGAASPFDPVVQGGWAQLTDDRTRLEALLDRPDRTADQQAVLLAPAPAPTRRRSAPPTGIASSSIPSRGGWSRTFASTPPGSSTPIRWREPRWRDGWPGTGRGTTSRW